MKVTCKTCPLRDMACFEPFTEDELRFMEQFRKGEMRVEAGTPILYEGAHSAQLFTVLDGVGLRTKMLENGSRQVINFVFPGDLVGMQSVLMNEMYHGVEATTEMHLCVFDRAELWDLFQNHPRRAFSLTWLSATQEHLLGEALATVGQRTGLERVAWAFVRLHQRGEAVHMLQQGAMPMPFRQQDIADALGLSLVHTNKMIARLRDRGLAYWQDGVLRIENMGALARIAGIDLGEAVPLRPLI